MLFFFEHYGTAGENLYKLFRNRNEDWPAHFHRAYEFIAVNEGKLFLQIDQKKYLLNAGDLAFIFSNQIHAFMHYHEGSQQSPSDITIALFSPETIDDFHLAHKNFVPVNNIITTPPWLDFYALDSIYKRKSVLYTLCDALLSSTKMENVDSMLHTTALQQIFAYIDINYKKNCSLKTAAKALQYDYTYLSKLFSKYTGISFTSFLNNYRISQACNLLPDERLTVSEIADRCGYANLRTFHRNFRKAMQCTPQEYIANKKCTPFPM